MLRVLFGNNTVEKVLLFLFVNGKCYGTQLHHVLNTPLTPLQKALTRLEKGGVLSSHYAGKTRLYQFNTHYPLLDALELLLKNAYTLLPAQEKKLYYVPQDTPTSPEHPLKILTQVWKKLGAIQKLTFHARTHLKETLGWNGKGSGEVAVTAVGDTILLFHEKGTWRNKQGEEVRFTNIFRWTLDSKMGVLSLEHLRRGPDHPVFLFHLAPTGAHTLASIDSHLCGEDIYYGQIHCDSHRLRLSWRVLGPKKNEELDYQYS